MHTLKRKLSLLTHVYQLKSQEKCRCPQPFLSKTLQCLVGWCQVTCHVVHQNDYDYLPLTVINFCNKFRSICHPFIASKG